ncbi:hypothetical protein [Micromonospora psammae]|uniref:hypothetical protein n=1 Tax=Micromonospora sp. CPCC 205556 TaxID=3122398 RepID=UPI002FF373F9
MTPEVYAHPVSFRRDAAGQAARLADAGVRRVRLAHAYHSGRWLLSSSDPAAVVDLDAGLWFTTGPAAPTGAGPADRAPLWPATVTALADTATAALTARGVEVTAWLVGLHQSTLATARPDLALRNAFDHPYRHALCPAHGEVVDYAAALAGRAAAAPGVTGLDLEAFSWLGWAHQGAHDKTGVALRPVDRWLLSLCHCPACAAAYSGAGIDPAELGGRVRAAVRAQLDRPRPAAPEIATDAAEALGAQLRDAVQTVRARLVRRLVGAAVAAADGTGVQLRATADPYATDGKAGGDLAALAAVAGGLTVTHLGGDLAALTADLAAARPHARTLTAGWNGAGTPAEARAAIAAARHAGADSIALYAYDLMPADRVDLLRDVHAPPARSPAPPARRRAEVAAR